MNQNINTIFILTKYNLNLLNKVLGFARPNRSFKSKTAKLIKNALLDTDKIFNPIVYNNNKFVIFWKTRKTMPTEVYFIYRKWIKKTFYDRRCNK